MIRDEAKRTGQNPHQQVRKAGEKAILWREKELIVETLGNFTVPTWVRERPTLYFAYFRSFQTNSSIFSAIYFQEVIIKYQLSTQFVPKILITGS